MKHRFTPWLIALFLCVAIEGRAGEPVARLPLTGSLQLHDPSTIVECDGQYWLFATGRGVLSRHSSDRLAWKAGPPVLTTLPAWTGERVPGNRGFFWAPEVIRVKDQYRLYYSVSTWGKNTSAIGLATARTLNPESRDYGWKDEGIVIESRPADNFNAIDPHVMLDTDGKCWMTFGSFWSGIKLVELDPATGKRCSPGDKIYGLAHHPAIEAPCLYRHEGYYYLFVNWGLCCRGTNSTYEIRVGRSETVTGPYLDKKGIDMQQGGGSLVLDSQNPFIGPGHAGIHELKGQYWLGCHFYDAEHGGESALAIMPLTWSNDGWPVMNAPKKLGISEPGTTLKKP